MGGHAVSHVMQLPASHYHEAASVCCVHLRALAEPGGLALVPANRATAAMDGHRLTIESI